MGAVVTQALAPGGAPEGREEIGCAEVGCSVAPSVRLRAMAALFGLRVTKRRDDRWARHLRTEARRVWRAAREPGVTLVVGPSGSGKSTLLRHVARCATRRGAVHWVRPRRDRTPLADRYRGGPGRTLDVLASAGLAEARLLARTPSELSEGQAARLALADALAEAQARAARGRGPSTLIADEFCSVLDRTTARSVAVTWRRAVRRAGLRAFVATAHDDVEAWLAPDGVVRVDLAGRVRVQRASPIESIVMPEARVHA
ncbi:MAG: AAA family ATPase [Planctomycetota bacterium]